MSTRPTTAATAATRRGEPRTPTKQTPVEKVPDQSDGGGGVASKEDSPSGDVMIGRKVVKSVGETVCSGVVREFFPPKGDEESKWKVEWDDGEETMAVVNRAELDKYLRMQMTKEAVFGPAATAGKRGRGRPRGAPSPKTPTTPTRKTPTRKTPTRKSPTPTKSRGRPRKSPSPSARGTASGKKRSATPSRGGSATKKGKTATVAKKGAPKRVVLYGNKSDVDKLIAKEFEDGIYTGEVVKVKTGATTLWNVRYEDGDGEDLNSAEMETCIKLYQRLLAKYNAATGSNVPAASKDEDAEEKQDDDDAVEPDEGGTVKSPSTRGKGKAKKTTPGPEGEGESMVGTRVRKVFQIKKGDVEYDGTVDKFFPEESDDEHGDMWLVNYDDGDAEHFDKAEVTAGKSLYEKHYALEQKEIDVSVTASAAGKGAKKSKKDAEKSGKMTMYAEKPEGSRIFGTLDGYRESKKLNP